MKLLDWIKSLALLSVVVFLGCGSYLCLVTAHIEKQLAGQVSSTIAASTAAIAHVDTAVTQVGTSFTAAATSIDQAQQSVTSVSTQLSGVVGGLQKTVALVNAPCVPGPCGTVANLDKAINTYRMAGGQIEIAANTFDKNESHFYAQEDQLFADSDGAVKNLDAILDSPDLLASIHNADIITSDLGQTTTDFQNKFHAFLYPPPCVGWKCHIKSIYQGVQIVSKFSEPAYWSWALANQINP